MPDYMLQELTQGAGAWCGLVADMGVVTEAATEVVTEVVTEAAMEVVTEAAMEVVTLRPYALELAHRFWRMP